VINSHRNLFTYILVLATLLSLTSGPLALVSSAEGLLHKVLDKVKGGDHKDSGDGDHKDSGDGDKDSDENPMIMKTQRVMKNPMTDGWGYRQRISK
jgi:hypothetical protein